MAETLIPHQEADLQARLVTDPNDFAALLQLAALLQDSRPDEALALLDRAMALNPGHAAPFTLKTKLLLRRHFGAPPAPRAMPPGLAAVSMRQLGENGRFGNQLLQYAFLRLYARTHGLTAQAPDWIGRDLFGFDDPLPEKTFVSVEESHSDLFASLNGAGPVFANHDLTGYFCQHTSAWKNRAADFRALYRPVPALQAILQQAMARLRERGKTVVAIHLRRGDFGYGPFWIAPTAWYQAWLNSIWDTLDAPVLYVASDDPGAAAEFARFGAVDATSLGVNLPGAEFTLDHYLLSQADHLAISNSSFSFTAALLNDKAQAFVRPDPNEKSLVAYEPWNADVLLQPDPARQSYSREEDTIISKWMGPHGTVVHVGSACSPWTALIRTRHPQLRIVEIGGEEPLDRIRQRSGLKHIHHLIVEDGMQLSTVLQGSADTIAQAGIGMIHWHGNPGLATRQQLEQHGYALFTVVGGALQPLTPALSGLPNPRIAVQKRLLTATQQP